MEKLKSVLMASPVQHFYGFRHLLTNKEDLNEETAAAAASAAKAFNSAGRKPAVFRAAACRQASPSRIESASSSWSWADRCPRSGAPV